MKQRTRDASDRSRARGLVCLLLALGMAGCVANRAPRVVPEAAAQAVVTRQTAAAPQDSLETFMAKVRTLAAEARPQRNAPATVEGRDPRLMAALAAASVRPAPETFRLVATEYHRLGIADRAHEYLNRALMLNPQDSEIYEALARMWRDWGFPKLALGDAYRAVYYAPASPSARNTLGTIFQALGRRQFAMVEYERALELDPSAAYALNNLCYGWILDGDGKRAASACLRALYLDPGLKAASNNLGLAYAATGELDSARAAFGRSGDRAAALYNLGIAHLAHREYASAVEAFRAAQTEKPSMRLAGIRAQQAEHQVSAAGGDE